MMSTGKRMVYFMATVMVALIGLSVQFRARAGEQTAGPGDQELFKKLTVRQETSVGEGPDFGLSLDNLAERLTLRYDLEAVGHAADLGAGNLTGQLRPRFEIQDERLAAAPLLGCGQPPEMGRIGDQNDQRTQGGLRFDAFTIDIQQPNQPYIITIRSTNPTPIVLNSELDFSDPQRGGVLVQGGFGAVMQFSGELSSPGQYILFVFVEDNPQNFGPYSVEFKCEPCAGGGGGSCAGGSFENPVQVSSPQTLTCELTSNDTPLQDGMGNTFFSKWFRVQISGQVTIRAQSTAFSPIILLFDPNTGQFTQQSQQGTLVVNGPATVTVTSSQPQRTGPFTIEFIR